MLEMAFKDTSEGVYIQTRKEADLFNVAQLKAKSKTSTKVVREMLFADESALAAHSAYAEDMKSSLEKFARTADQFSLKINSEKTEFPYQPPKFQFSTSLLEEISTGTESLVKCKTFKYLGSTVSENAWLEDELSLTMGKASSAFGNLRERL